MYNKFVDHHYSKSFLCFECHAGIYKRKLKTYLTWLDDELICVPNFPTWVCDVCGRCEFDEDAIIWLRTMLSTETRKTHFSRNDPNPANANRAQT